MKYAELDFPILRLNKFGKRKTCILEKNNCMVKNIFYKNKFISIKSTNFYIFYLIQKKRSHLLVCIGDNGPVGYFMYWERSPDCGPNSDFTGHSNSSNKRAGFGPY